MMPSTVSCSLSSQTPLAMRLSETFIRESIGDMARRCQRLYAAKGHHIEEGGKGE